MHARMYGPMVGRFLSVDPGRDTKAAVRRPQTWNRYAYVIGNPLRFTDPSGAYVEVAGEENQRIFFDAVTGSMAPGAARNLKWKGNRLTIVGMSAWAFSKMYGDVGHQLAYLTSSPQTFKVEIGPSRLAAKGGGGWWEAGKQGGGTIYMNPARFPRELGGVQVGFNEALIHELAHAVGTLIPGVQDRFNGSVRGFYPLAEGYAMAVENQYRRSVLGLGDRDIRAWYSMWNDYVDPGAGAAIYP